MAGPPEPRTCVCGLPCGQLHCLLPRVISRFPPVTMWRWVVVSLGDVIQVAVATVASVRSWVRFNREASQKSQKGPPLRHQKPGHAGCEQLGLCGCRSPLRGCGHPWETQMPGKSQWPFQQRTGCSLATVRRVCPGGNCLQLPFSKSDFGWLAGLQQVGTIVKVVLVT